MKTIQNIRSEKTKDFVSCLRRLPIVFACGAMVGIFGCAQSPNFSAAPDSKDSLNSQSPLILTPPAAQLAYSSTLNLVASGGTLPYQFTQTPSTDGSLTANSDGTSAQFSAGSTDGTVTIQVKDADGNVATAQVIVQGTQAQNTTGTIQGNITNSTDGTPLAGVQVSVVMNGNTVATATTDVNGNYVLSGLAPGSYTISFSKANYVPITGVAVTVVASQVSTVNDSMSTVLSSGQYRIVMTWCDHKSDAVRDMDSYLSVPGYSNPVSFHNHNEGSSQLDHDVTTWKGPETITINSLSSGTYTYYVNNYSDRDDHDALGNSNVHVNVYQGSSLIKSYDVPPGDGITYEVFQIVNGQIVDVNAYNKNLFYWGPQ